MQNENPVSHGIPQGDIRDDGFEYLLAWEMGGDAFIYSPGWESIGGGVCRGHPGIITIDRTETGSKRGTKRSQPVEATYSAVREVREEGGREYYTEER